MSIEDIVTSGITIPAEAYNNSDLTRTEKLLFGALLKLIDGTGDYVGSSRYLGNIICEKSPRVISTAITKLTKLGYLKVKQKVDDMGGSLSISRHVSIDPEYIETYRYLIEECLEAV